MDEFDNEFDGKVTNKYDMITNIFVVLLIAFVIRTCSVYKQAELKIDSDRLIELNRLNVK